MTELLHRRLHQTWESGAFESRAAMARAVGMSASTLKDALSKETGTMCYRERLKDAEYLRALKEALEEGTALPDVAEIASHETEIAEDAATCRLVTPDLVKNEEELIERSGLDAQVWRVEKMTVKAYGQAQKGSEEGEPVVVQLWSVAGKFSKREKEIRARQVAERLIERAKSHVPCYETWPAAGQATGTPHLLKICIADHHIGKYVDPALTGETWTIEEALDLHGQVVRHFLAQSAPLNIEKILIFAGNDVTHVDNLKGQTTHGTQVGREGDYGVQFEAAHRAYVDMIDQCLQLAPVDVQVIPGNHDEQTCFSLGHALMCWYHEAKNVDVDYSLAPRKYYRYGVNLFGATHGKDTKHKQLPGLMSHEAKQDWAKCWNYEYDTGHLHHRKSFRPNQHEEIEGVLVRVNPALCPPDLYHVRHGYTRSLRSAVARAYSRERGFAAEYAYNQI